MGAAAFAADGGVVVAWLDGGVETFPLEEGSGKVAERTRRWAARRAGARIGDLVLGSRWALTAGGGPIEVWDLEPGAQPLPAVALKGPIPAARFLADGHLVAAGPLQPLILYDLAAGKAGPAVEGNDEISVTALDVSPDGALPAELQESLKLGTHGEVFATLLQSAAEPAGPVEPVTLAAKDRDPAGLPRPERRTW